ncbi:MAG: ferrochelatase [Cyanobacteria bacterium]|nr:ferrochelatase [Cyanobacteriota bacterium]
MVKHVVLVTYGEPTGPGIREHLTYSWRLMQGVARSTADIAPPVLPLIALRRAHERSSLWRKHRYQSPLEPVTLAQAAQIRNALARQSSDTWRIHVGYEFREPQLLTVIKHLPRREQVIIVPMYAAASGFTHDLSKQSARYIDFRRPAPIIVAPPLAVERLASISADHVLQSTPPGADKNKTALVLAARGSLLKPAKDVETGRAMLERLGQAIARRLSSSFGMVATGWLNYGRGDKWTAPPIRATLRKVREAGFRDVVYFPYGFLADSSESQLFGRLAVASQPELKVVYVPCLNGSFELAEVLAAEIIAAH